MGRGRPSAPGQPGKVCHRLTSAKTPRLIAFGAIAVLLLVVGSGQFYRMAGEGRVIGLGEEPLWFPHEAAKFAGRTGHAQPFPLVSQWSRLTL